MKKYIIALFFCVSLIHAAPTPLEVTIADTLASYDIIVEQKTTTAYRLGDTITRAEAVGVALRVADVTLPEKYFCRNYFRDVQYDRINNWICRAIETASDYNIISRSNDLARPKTPISRIEALAIVMRAGKVPYAKNVDRSGYPADMPQWEVDILEGALQYHIISSSQNFGPDMFATRIDVFGMIYNMRFAGTKMEYITDKSTPLPPLTSAPEEGKEGISITLPGKTTTTTPPTTSTPSTSFGAFNSFSITAPTEVKANTPFDIVVKALDKNGKIVTNYNGTIYFDLLEGSYDNFSLGINDEGYTFSGAEKGVMTFKNVILKQAGTYKIDIYEIESGLDITKTITLTATDGYVSTVTNQNATQLADFVISTPVEVKINTPFDFTVSAVNSAGQVLTNYLGTIYFDTNNLESDVTFPNTQQSYTFTTADKGIHKFTGGFKFKQPGTYEIIVYEVDVIPDGVQKLVKIIAKN